MEVTMNKCILAARLYVGFEFNPEDYLNCADRKELRDTILDHMYDEVDYGDISVDESETELEGFEEFYERWNELKKNENS